MKVLPLLVASMLLGTSCLVRVPMGGVYGHGGFGPPPARVEIIGRAPSRGHVWLPGRWARGGNNGWEWRQGTWERGRPGHGWVPGRWESRRHGQVWIEGHWRRY